jgi:hypothetical protein
LQSRSFLDGFFYLYQIPTGSSFGFAINANGELFGWGFNANGQLGNGTTNQQINPIQIGTETSWQEISGAVGAPSGGTVYGTHSLGLQWPNSSICSTGSNYLGQLGDNTNEQSEFFTCITGELNVGIEEIVEFDNFIVMPNPSNGLFTINAETLNSNRYNCRVFDATGKEIYKNSFNTDVFPIDLRGLSKGFYIIVLENETLSLKKRVIIT